MLNINIVFLMEISRSSLIMTLCKSYVLCDNYSYWIYIHNTLKITNSSWIKSLHWQKYLHTWQFKDLHIWAIGLRCVYKHAYILLDITLWLCFTNLTFSHIILGLLFIQTFTTGIPWWSYVPKISHG